MNSIYTAESVTSGHPDKICDQISDAILDECLRQDPLSRVAVETFGGHGHLIIGGEVTTKAKVDYAKIGKKVYKDIGHNDHLDVEVYVEEQSPDISQGVDTGGAGDQGIMYGFATNETKEALPKGVVLAHALVKKLEEVRRKGGIKWLLPDGKSQVTINNGKVVSVLVSTQHKPNVSRKEMEDEITKKIIKPIIGKDLSGIEVLINPSGKFELGGFYADTGLTGRKLMVDTYGGVMPHGGGAFSGKDSTKVDRSGAYMARFVAKNLVMNGFAKNALVSVAYAIGKAEPVMVEAVDENGKSLKDIVDRNFDFRPQSIIKRLGLRKPIFQKTAAYGHFGKSGLPWEKVVKIK
ncbi:MAG: methionine adenosyltransferase [Candidatus Paceibacterota bacterium]